MTKKGNDMARVLEVTVYKLDELDAAMQQRVISNWRDGGQFPWSEEWRYSLDAFAKIAPLTVRNWEVGYRSNGVTFDMDRDDNYGDGIAEMSGVRAWKWLINNCWAKLAAGQDCPFTGYCGDEDLLDAIRAAIANPASITSLRDVFADALHDWAKAFERDIDHWGSEEAIREDIEANEYEFNANGTLA
jgi:hypothetical protein